MAKIRHIAIMTEDQEKLVAFYKNTFEMKEVYRHMSGKGTLEEGKEAIYLSDGTINLAILPACGRPEGIHHFGMHVEDYPGTAERAMAGGAMQAPQSNPEDGRFAEGFILDPVGTRVDMSTKGWRV
ncbi:MAG: VOC family protein, partial [Betaproteobacteria bacterium]|nr:VOC family protein [Betaproteobacteria bacterium]